MLFKESSAVLLKYHVPDQQGGVEWGGGRVRRGVGKGEGGEGRDRLTVIQSMGMKIH